ncbi:succinylglutamate desuccinylase/aspartoacylase family protein [Cellvibrio sp. ARAG 10.3]|uniref:succinylglutamate desuccinylase/aspartoacylase family protein n=1 Tax=Cellvibrio sp. ARAG 10.3 TaxID=3451358 RepID=UPI003F457FC9
MTICSVKQLIRLVLFSVLFFPVVAFAQGEEENNSGPGTTLAAVEESASASSASSQPLPKAESINLGEVIPELQPPKVVAASSEESSASSSSELTASSSARASSLPAAPAPATSVSSSSVASASREQTVTVSSVADEITSADGEPASSADTPQANPEENVTEEEPVILSKFILGVEVPPNTSSRLVWMPEEQLSGFAEQTPVLIVNGANPGKTLCLTAAVHGDELNGIEMIRRVMYNLEPDKLTGTVIGIPVVNLMGFRRNSRYLPDRRDLNRYFPGNTKGSSASRIAHSFFSQVIRHCDALVDIHTGSFHRTNLTQLRADLSDEKVAALAQNFGTIAVLNSRGNYGSLRAAAVRFGVPSVTMEAGEPMRMQSEVVSEGVKAIQVMMTKTGMYGKASKWYKPAPVYYKSTWVRANQSGILFSQAPLGKRVMPGEVLGTVTDPITNARSEIVSPYRGRILGMALDQVVLPGFAAYHIGIQTPEAILIEEGQMEDEDGDDAGIEPVAEDLQGSETTKPQDSLEDE